MDPPEGTQFGRMPTDLTSELTLLSKEVWKLNFRQYGKMERAQQGRNSDVEKVRSEKIRDGEEKK